MTEKIITITSKNQITLPAEYVRKLKLTKNRTMTIRLKGTSLELKPQPSLEERMQKHWDKFKATHPNFPALSDKELNQAIRESVVIAWNEKEKRARGGN